MRRPIWMLSLLLVLVVVWDVECAAQRDPFDRVEKVLRLHGKGVYENGNSLNRDIIKGKYSYCFIMTKDPVRWEGKRYVPDRESPTCVTMWKENYDQGKGPGEGKIIIWVTRTALGSYGTQVSGKDKIPCSKKEAFEVAEQIIKESGL
jgi:hypothetical protein